MKSPPLKGASAPHKAKKFFVFFAKSRSSPPLYLSYQSPITQFHRSTTRSFYSSLLHGSRALFVILFFYPDFPPRRSYFYSTRLGLNSSNNYIVFASKPKKSNIPLIIRVNSTTFPFRLNNPTSITIICISNHAPFEPTLIIVVAPFILITTNPRLIDLSFVVYWGLRRAPNPALHSHSHSHFISSILESDCRHPSGQVRWADSFFLFYFESDCRHLSGQVHWTDSFFLFHFAHNRCCSYYCFG